jgi:hypothetical protein
MLILKYRSVFVIVQRLRLVGVLVVVRMFLGQAASFDA